MGSKGDCFDNAVAESFFATLKKELVHRQSWPTRRELTSEVFEYIEGFYNRTRRHSTLGMLPRRLREDHKHKQQQLGKANQASTSPRKRGKTRLSWPRSKVIGTMHLTEPICRPAHVCRVQVWCSIQ
jgi:transposase InsO family protein